MHDLAPIILDTWQQLQPHLQANPTDFAKRLARRHGKMFTRWPRAWCLAIRAADHRIDDYYGWTPRDHIYLAAGHTVTLTSDLVRHLVRPVFLDQPHMQRDDVARALGVHRATLNRAIQRNVFETHRTIPLLAGKRGPAVPVLGTSKQLDPGWGRLRRGPHPIWGTHIRYLNHHVPDDIEQTLTRIPLWITCRPPNNRGTTRPRPTPDYVFYKWTKDGHYLGEPGDAKRARERELLAARKAKRWAEQPPPSRTPITMFRGYYWICPVCDHKAKILHYPLELFIVQLLDKEFPPGHPSALPTPLKQFACRRCHRLADFPMANPVDCWNRLITRLSDGLLYGHEVPCPERPKGVEGPHFFTPQRTRPYKPLLPGRPAPRRDHVRTRLLQGFTPHQIAAEMKVKPITVYKYACEIYRQSGVRTLREFLLKHGHPHPTKRDLVAHHLRTGASNNQIAAATRLSPNAVSLHIMHLYRRYKAKTRPALIRAVCAHDPAPAPTRNLARTNTPA